MVNNDGDSDWRNQRFTFWEVLALDPVGLDEVAFMLPVVVLGAFTPQTRGHAADGKCYAARMDNNAQPGIAAPLMPHGRHVFLDVAHGTATATAKIKKTLSALQNEVDGEQCVVGMGPSLLHRLDAPAIALVHDFMTVSGPEVSVPATPRALWLWLRGDDIGEIMHRARALELLLAPAFVRYSAVNVFTHTKAGRDLSGYVDGSENPRGKKANTAAFIQGRGAGLDGGSTASIQQWHHRFAAFDAMPQGKRDAMMGRRQSDNEELKNAPSSAHVKRAAQEQFAPEAFVLRRSQPFVDEDGGGLLFLAFGHSQRAFEVQLNRMAGLDDGITDALFQMSAPRTGMAFFCPPCVGGHLDLSSCGV